MIHRGGALLPMVSVLFVIVISSWLAGLGEPQALGDDVISSLQIRLPSDHSPPGLFPGVSKILLSHISWTITSLLFIFACLGGIGICWHMVLASLLGMGKGIRIMVPSGAILLAGIGFLLTRDTSPMLEHRLLLDLNRKTFEIAGNTDVLLVDQVSHGLTCMAIFFLLAAASSILVRHAEDPPAPDPLQIIAAQMRRLKTVIHIGAVQLVLGVLNASAQYRWSEALVEKQAADAIRKLAASMATLDGAFFTLLLLAIYLPAAFILRARAKTLERGSSPEAGKDEGHARLSGQGIASSPFQELGQMFAILAPLIAGGPIIKLMNLINP